VKLLNLVNGLTINFVKTNHKVTNMKKTLIAFAVTAMAATSANAAVIYKNEGTKVDLDGRGALEIVNVKGKRTDLVDRGSRVRVRAYQELGGGFTALSAVELRFTTNGTVGDGVKAQRLFVGFSHEDVGSLTFGRQLTLGDHIPKANYSYELGGNVLHDSAPKAVHFMSNKFSGFRFATDYYFGEADKSKAANGQGYGVGAFYDGQWDDLAVRFGSGYVEIIKGTTPADDYKQKMLGVLASLSLEMSLPLVVFMRIAVGFPVPWFPWNILNASSRAA